MEKDNVKTASTQDLQKAMDRKPIAAKNTGVDPYKRAQSYLKAMQPAISEALPKSKGMDAERLSRITLTTLKTNPKLLECSIESCDAEMDEQVPPGRAGNGPRPRRGSGPRR